MTDNDLLVLKNKEVLVTGGCGFIGSEIVKQLSLIGANVTIIDNLSSGKEKYIQGLSNVKLITADLLDDQAVESVFIVIVVKDENGNIIEANSTPLFDNGNEDILFPQQREFFTVTLNSNPGNVFSKEVEIFYDILDGENTDPDIP